MMKTALAIGLAIGLGAASMGWAFDQDALNSRKANVTYGKMEQKVKKIEKTATVAVTHDRSIGGGERDLGKADTSSLNSREALTRY
jgi:hypothetical protein